MLWVQLGLSVVSVVIYIALNQSRWLTQVRGNAVARRAYFAGLLFAGLYYYGFPILWWRYGIGTTVKLLVTCIIVGAAFQALLLGFGKGGANDSGKSLVVAMLIAVPIRAIAGIWVARNDGAWRDAIVVQRKTKSKAVKL